MSLPLFSGTGRLIEDPELRFSQSGAAVCSLRFAFNARRKKANTGEWEDGDVFFIRGTVFKEAAENVAESLNKGDEVNVTGRLKTDQWEDKSTREKRSAPVLLVDSIGPNLRWARAKLSRADRGGGQRQSTEDPWTSPSDSDDTSGAPPF